MVLGSFLFVWPITRNYNFLSSGAVVLLGISAATGLGAVVVDSNKSSGSMGPLNALEKERNCLEEDISALRKTVGIQPAPGTLVEVKRELDTKEARVREIGAELGKWASRGFLTDILSDGIGISFHRFQMAVWTVVLSIVFLVQVYMDLYMPEFSATLLSVMGISSGTYVGFKFPDSGK